MSTSKSELNNEDANIFKLLTSDNPAEREIGQACGALRSDPNNSTKTDDEIVEAVGKAAIDLLYKELAEEISKKKHPSKNARS